MKALTVITFAGVAGLSVLGVAMAMTNPGQSQYEGYAMQRLTKEILKSDFCTKAPKLLGSLIELKVKQLNCDELIKSADPKIKEIIASTTNRQNYIVFSIYTTDLKITSWIPSYKFETVGAFGNFYTYTAEQR